MKWHCFTVKDDSTGLDIRFRWRKGLCGYSGTDYRFQMYSGMHGRWISLRDFVDLDEGIRYCHEIDFQELYRTLADI